MQPPRFTQNDPSKLITTKNLPFIKIKIRETIKIYTCMERSWKS